jgi:antitoxin (DNA-binding transcriptional repressor) of toxin-antitoxin stability system
MGFRAMIRVKMHAAKTNLSRLVAQAQAGEEVVLMRGDETVARIVPYGGGEPAVAPGSPRIPGRLRGQIDFDDRFFEPFPGNDQTAWDH